MTAYTFDQLIDFTRTSGGGYFGPDGLFRFTPASRNLLLQTQEFDSGSWSKSGANVYPFDPAMATFGPELVTNGTFTSDLSGWNVGTDPLQVVPTWSSGAVVLTRGSGGTLGFSQVTTLTSGRFCRISFDVTSGVAAVGGAVNSTGGLTGSVTLYLAITGGATIQFWPNSPSSSCTIDNISVREVIGGLITAPDGTLTADALIENVVASTHQISQNASGGLVAGQPYALSIYAKLGAGSRFLQLRFASGGVTGDPRVNFDLLTGTYDVSAGHSASITPVGDGWYRCAFVVASATGASGAVAFNLASSLLTAFAPSYTGDGASSIYLWGAQLELAAAATDYTRNVGGLYPPRFDYDPVTLAPRGLLIEEQRTNLLLRAEEFENASWSKIEATVTTNAIASPDGTVDADKFIPSTNAAAHYMAQAVTSTTSQCTGTIYVKLDGSAVNKVTLFPGSGGTFAHFNLSTLTSSGEVNVSSTSITDVGNGWYRLSATWVAGTTINSLRFYASSGVSGAAATEGDGTSGIYVWGAQLEAGAFATSYIPTAASQVTRASDNATITGANFSRWYNQSEGTFVAEYSSSSIALGTASKGLASANDGSGNNRVYGYISNTGTLSELVTNAGATEGLVSFAGTVPNGVTNKSAWVYKVNDFAILNNGGTVAADNTGAPPSTPNRLEIGQHLSGNQLNGHIRRIRYYPTRLSNTQLQALTA